MKISMNKRKIGYTYGSVSGHFSFRQQKSIAFESTLERDLLTILEFNDSVDDVIEQPLTIEYTNHNGRIVEYTPDFLVYFKEPEAELMKIQRKPFLIEVKPKDKIKKDWQNLKRKFKVANQYARANDMIFKIYDESRIRTQYLENILFLKRFKRFAYSLENEEKILAYSNAVGNISIEYILEYLNSSKEEKAILLGHIWQLVLNKKLLCHLDKKLSIQTEVWMNETIEMEQEL